MRWVVGVKLFSRSSLGLAGRCIALLRTQVASSVVVRRGFGVAALIITCIRLLVS